MNKFMSSLEKVLMPLAEKIGQNKLLIAIRDGFLVSSPLLIIGSIFLLIANFQFQVGQNSGHSFLVLIGHQTYHIQLLQHLM